MLVKNNLATNLNPEDRVYLETQSLSALRGWGDTCLGPGPRQVSPQGPRHRSPQSLRHMSPQCLPSVSPEPQAPVSPVSPPGPQAHVSPVSPQGLRHMSPQGHRHVSPQGPRHGSHARQAVPKAHGKDPGKDPGMRLPRAPGMCLPRATCRKCLPKDPGMCLPRAPGPHARSVFPGPKKNVSPCHSREWRRGGGPEQFQTPQLSYMYLRL